MSFKYLIVKCIAVNNTFQLVIKITVYIFYSTGSIPCYWVSDNIYLEDLIQNLASYS